MPENKPVENEIPTEQEIPAHQELLDKAEKQFSEQKYEEALEASTRLYNDESVEQSIRAQAAFLSAKISKEIYRDIAFYWDWIQKASDMGSLNGALRLGKAYRDGVPGTGRKKWIFRPDPIKSARYFELAAERGSQTAMFETALNYDQGSFPRNYEKAFDWMLKAACKKQEYCKHLSDYFMEGRVTNKNILEAYIWAIMGGRHCDYHYKNKLEKQLTPEQSEFAQAEAQKRVKINDFFRANFMELYENVKEALQNQSQTQTDSSSPQISTQTQEDIKPQDEPKSTSYIEYNYLNNCKTGFDPKEVLIELVIDTEIKGNQEIDFDSIVVSYKNAGSDTKPREVLNKYLQKRHRRFLIKLAIQFSKDKDEINSALKRVIQDCDDRPMVSKINKMFLEMFPGCHKRSQSTMINHQEGRLLPKLKVDVLNIIDSNDYKNWYNY